MTTMIPILRDFKSILDLDLYGEHMPEERITGSKIDLDLSAGSTYMRVYTVTCKESYTHFNQINIMNLCHQLPFISITVIMK